MLEKLIDVYNVLDTLWESGTFKDTRQNIHLVESLEQLIEKTTGKSIEDITGE